MDADAHQTPSDARNDDLLSVSDLVPDVVALQPVYEVVGRAQPWDRHLPDLDSGKEGCH